MELANTSLLPLIRQFATFCGVGIINTIAGLSVILLLSEVMGLHYLLANSGGYAAGLTISFILHKKITFRATAPTRPTKSQALTFLLIFVISYGAQLIVLVALMEKIGLSNLVSQIIAVGVYTVLNFAGNRYVTFRTGPDLNQTEKRL